MSACRFVAVAVLGILAIPSAVLVGANTIAGLMVFTLIWLVVVPED